VIGHREGKIRSAYLASSHTKTFKSLRAGDFVDQMAIDVDQAGAVVASLDDVRIPDLFI
jgi:hypothetical protein